MFGGKAQAQARATDDDAASDISMPDATNTASGSDAPVMGDAFQLAQLLFIVGHVALKHIVYLELVEREYKRRKAEADKEKAVAKAVSEAKPVALLLLLLLPRWRSSTRSPVTPKTRLAR